MRWGSMATGGRCALFRLSWLVLVQVAGLAVCVVVWEISLHLQLSAPGAAGREANGSSSPAGAWMIRQRVSNRLVWEDYYYPLTDKKRCIWCVLPETILERVDFTAQTLAGFSSVIQLSLQLPAGGVCSSRLLLSLLQLPLHLLHARVGLFHLKPNARWASINYVMNGSVAHLTSETTNHSSPLTFKAFTGNVEAKFCPSLNKTVLFFLFLQSNKHLKTHAISWTSGHLLFVLVGMAPLILHLHEHLLELLLCAAHDFIGCGSLPVKSTDVLTRSCFYTESAFSFSYLLLTSPPVQAAPLAGWSWPPGRR